MFASSGIYVHKEFIISTDLNLIFLSGDSNLFFLQMLYGYVYEDMASHLEYFFSV